jgi:hypothetical protein
MGFPDCHQLKTRRADDMATPVTHKKLEMNNDYVKM